MTGKSHRIMIHARSICFSIAIIFFCMVFIHFTALNCFGQAADTSGQVEEKISTSGGNQEAKTETEKPAEDKNKKAETETEALTEDKDKEERSEKEEPAEGQNKEAKAQTKVNPEKNENKKDKKDKKDEKVKTSVKEYPIFAHGKLSLEVPTEWIDELQKPAPDSPPTISFKPKSGNDFQILVAVMLNESDDPEFNSPERIKGQVERWGMEMLSHAVESKMNIQMLQGETNTGYYFSLTDEVPELGMGKFVTQGGVGLGDLMIGFTIFTDSKDSKVISYALTMFKNASQKSILEENLDSQSESAAEDKEEDYHYNPVGKRDPFFSKVFLEEKRETTPNKQMVGVQRYELAELTLVGIIWGELGRKAVVETPEGKSYLITVGTPIGKRDGVVKAITKNELVIQEFTSDYLGNRLEKITLLKIERKPGEQ